MFLNALWFVELWTTDICLGWNETCSIFIIVCSNIPQKLIREILNHTVYNVFWQTVAQRKKKLFLISPYFINLRVSYAFIICQLFILRILLVYIFSAYDLYFKITLRQITQTNQEINKLIILVIYFLIMTYII